MQGLNGNKYLSINNYLKCQWTKCSKQKTWRSRVDKKQESTCLKLVAYKRSTLGQRTHIKLKLRGWQNILSANENDEKAGIAILV